MVKYTCFYCGEIIVRGAAVLYGSKDEKTDIALHDCCARTLGRELIEMGERGIEIVRNN